MSGLAEDLERWADEADEIAVKHSTHAERFRNARRRLPARDPVLLPQEGDGPIDMDHEIEAAKEALKDKRPLAWEHVANLLVYIQDLEEEGDRAARSLQGVRAPSPEANARAISYMLDYLAFAPSGERPAISQRGAESVVAILEGYTTLRERLESEGYRPPYAFYDAPWMRRYEGDR